VTLLRLCTAHAIVTIVEQLRIAFVCHIIQDHPKSVTFCFRQKYNEMTG